MPAALYHPGPPPTRVFTKRLPPPSPAWGQRSGVGPQRFLTGCSFRASTLRILVPHKLATAGMSPQRPRPRPSPDQRRTRALELGAKLSSDPKTSAERLVLTPRGRGIQTHSPPPLHLLFSSSPNAPAFLRQCSSEAVAVFPRPTAGLLTDPVSI